METRRTCIQCGWNKPIEEFYMYGERRRTCNECEKSRKNEHSKKKYHQKKMKEKEEPLQKEEVHHGIRYVLFDVIRSEYLVCLGYKLNPEAWKWMTETKIDPVTKKVKKGQPIPPDRTPEWSTDIEKAAQYPHAVAVSLKKSFDKVGKRHIEIKNAPILTKKIL